MGFWDLEEKCLDFLYRLCYYISMAIDTYSGPKQPTPEKEPNHPPRGFFALLGLHAMAVVARLHRLSNNYSTQDGEPYTPRRLAELSKAEEQLAILSAQKIIRQLNPSKPKRNPPESVSVPIINFSRAGNEIKVSNPAYWGLVIQTLEENNIQATISFPDTDQLSRHRIEEDSHLAPRLIASKAPEYPDKDINGQPKTN